MLLRIVALIWKEFLAVLKDKKSRISILLPPIIQLIIFTPAATLDVKNVPVGILSKDSGKEAFELTQRFQGSPFFNRIVYLKSEEEIQPFIDQQKGVMVVSIDELFSRNLNEEKTATVQLILDGRKSNTAQILMGYTEAIIEQYTERDSKIGVCQGGALNLNQALLSPKQPNLNKLGDAGGFKFSGCPTLAEPIFESRAVYNREFTKENAKLFPRFWFNPNLIYSWYNIPSLVATLSMLACLIVTTQSVARERELGTFDQLLVSPLIPFEILVGKIVPGIAIGMVEGSFLMGMGILLYQVPFTGSLLLFFLSLFVFVSAISGVGLFISSLSFTQQQAMLGTFVFMLPSVLLSGFATPIENMPIWLQPITYLIPLKYMLVISKGLFLKAISARVVFHQIWPMCLIAFFNIVGAGLFFKRRIQ